jgi:hypothetical protein
MFTTARIVRLSFLDSQPKSKLSALLRSMLVTKSMFARGFLASINVEMWLNFVTFCHDLALRGYTSRWGKTWKMSIFLD